MTYGTFIASTAPPRRHRHDGTVMHGTTYGMMLCHFRTHQLFLPVSMRRVIKIGGSLLRRDGLVDALQNWLRQQPPADTIAIVGGGEIIDAVRGLDESFSCDPAWLHWQCVGLLQFTFQWLGRQLSDWQLYATPDQFSGLVSRLGSSQQADDASNSHFSSMSANHLIDVNSFYRVGQSTPLPEDWTTTTDAIAGWLAVIVEADELVLLKSCDVDESLSLIELADRCIIDRALLVLADRIPPVRFVNLGEANS